MNGKILCLVRSGEAGRVVQEQAIAYARKHQKELTFLHVVDSSQMEIEYEELRPAVDQELTWLARVSLSIARRRATAHGGKAEIEIIYGSFFDAVVNYINQHPIERVFIGAPHPGLPNFHVRLERVQRFADRMMETSGIPVEVVVSKMESRN